MAIEPKLIYLTRRHPGLTKEEFIPRWRRHGALGMSMPRWSNIRRYAHCDVLQRGLPNVREDYDGVGMIWHRSMEARVRHRSDASSQAVMEADEARTFAQPIANVCLLAFEESVLSGEYSSSKVFRFSSRPIDDSMEQFTFHSRQWARHVSEGALRSAGVCRYIQNFVLAPERGAGWGLKADCVDEFSTDPSQNLDHVISALQSLLSGAALFSTGALWVAANEVVLHDVPR